VFAVTIQKAQAQTLKSVAGYLMSPIFFHGNLCVTFSRVCSFDNIAVAVVEGH
jgi:hypothetical protein